MTRVARSTAWWAALIVILLVATFLRLYRLDSAPPGMPIDEIVDAGVVRAIAAGWRPIFIEQGWGREPLYHYIAALLFPFVRDGQMTIRLTSAFMGIALVAIIGWAILQQPLTSVQVLCIALIVAGAIGSAMHRRHSHLCE